MYRQSHLAALLVVVLVAGAWLLPSGVDGAIQTGTPPVSFPVTPAPVDCTVEPRAAESLLALLGTPPSDEVIYAPEDEPTVVPVPVGQPADREVQAAITATIYELHACFNAGENLSGFALVTDGYLQTLAEEQSLTTTDLEFFLQGAAPVPPEDYTTLLAVSDVSVLPSGHVGAFVVSSDMYSGADTHYAIFSRQGERWLIDEIIDFL